ncbi:hypothetical protein BDF19DRAFT_463517 [Syncephalis fuscata]|nr:hypothetical protein BDF19DRAFT_463517 [Syncephalis fuscata]
MSSTIDWTVTLIAVLGGALCGYMEATGQYNLPYSKFQERAFGTWMASRGQCHPKRAFIITYLFGFILCISAFWKYGKWHSPYHVVAGGFLIGHQIKRLGEVCFVHRYSGQLSNIMAAILMLANAAASVVCAYAVLYRPPTVAEDRFRAVSWPIPLVLLAWGGNLYHHRILATLRPTVPIRRYNAAEAYRIPGRGWFLRSACPHYYFEILAWFAFALIVHRAIVYGVAIGIMLFLAGRSWRTRNWYYENIDGFTQGVSCIVPFGY